MNDLNSDQLRELLIGNTLKMNALTAENDTIVATLKQRGLQAIGKVSSEHVVFVDKFVIKDSLGNKIADSDWPNRLAKPVPRETDHYSPVLRAKFELKRCKKVGLTDQELKMGGWYCQDGSDSTLKLLEKSGVRIFTGRLHQSIALEPLCVFMANMPAMHAQIYPLDRINRNALKEIVRLNGEFYWLEL